MYMDMFRNALIAILILTTIFLSGCTSGSPVAVQPPGSSATETEFDHLLLSPADLPEGLVRAGDGPLQASKVTDTMRKYGWQRGYRALYSDAIPLTDKTKVIEQDIMIFTRANASAMLDEHKKSFTGIKSKDITVLPLPDPGLGEKSFAIKVTSPGTAGVETHYYVVGFVQSDIYEVISAVGEPATYRTLLSVAERAAEKAR
jgi:hypothetical protein